MKADELKIDSKLRDLIDRPDDAQYAQLEKRLKTEGYNADEKIEYWDGHDIVVDGHTRLAICREHNIPIPDRALKPIVFPNREAVEEYMVLKQISRRNLNPARYRYFVGFLYEREKGKAGVKADGRTDEKVAKKAGVNARTVRRSAKFKEAVDALPEETKRAVLSGKVKAKAVVSKEAPTKTKRRQGAARFAWGESAREMGRVIRIPDRIREVYAEKFKDETHEAMTALMREFAELFEQSRKKLAK